MNTNLDSLGDDHKSTSTRKQNHTGFKLTIVTQMLCIIGLLAYILVNEQKEDGDDELYVSMAVLEQRITDALGAQAVIGNQLKEQKSDYIVQKSELKSLRSRLKILEVNAAKAPKNVITSDILSEAITLSAKQSIALTKAMTQRAAEDLELKMDKKDRALVKALAKSVAEKIVVDAKQQDEIKTLNRKVDRLTSRLSY